MTRPFFHPSPKPPPTSDEGYALSSLEQARRKAQAALLERAKGGDREAVRKLREKGLVRWESEGRRIL